MNQVLFARRTWKSGGAVISETTDGRSKTVCIDKKQTEDGRP